MCTLASCPRKSFPLPSKSGERFTKFGKITGDEARAGRKRTFRTLPGLVDDFNLSPETRFGESPVDCGESVHHGTSRGARVPVPVRLAMTFSVLELTRM